MSLPSNVAAVGEELGILSAELEEKLSSAPMKERVKMVTEEALGKGVFGSPFFIADGEPFWGWDRIPMLSQWLGTGSW